MTMSHPALSIKRALALALAALVCALAVTTALAPADAHAAAAQGVHSGKPATSQRLDITKDPATRSGRAFWNNTDISFRNSAGITVSVATMYYDPSFCAGDGLSWHTEGWYNLAPGQVSRLMSTTARYAYWYAEASDGRHWEGNWGYNGRVTVFDNAFDSCMGLGSTAGRTVGFNQIDTQGLSRYEMNILP